MSEIDDLITQDPPLGQGWRQNRGVIDSHPQLLAWAQELKEKSRENPAISMTYAAEILRKLCDKHGLSVAPRITNGLVAGWWRRNP